MRNPQVAALRQMTKGTYALQKLRVQTGLRLCANFRAKLQGPGDKVQDDRDELSEEAEKVIDQLKAEYRLLATGVAKNRTLPKREGFVGSGIISDWAELVLVHQYEQLEKQERANFRMLEEALAPISIYNQWLKNQIGIGPAMAAVLLSYFDVYRAERPSQFWAVAGLDVGPDGFARSRRAAH